MRAAQLFRFQLEIWWLVLINLPWAKEFNIHQTIMTTSKAMPIHSKALIQILSWILPCCSPRRTLSGMLAMPRLLARPRALRALVKVPLASLNRVYSHWSRNYQIMCKMVRKEVMLRILGSKMRTQQPIALRSCMKGSQSCEGATPGLRTPSRRGKRLRMPQGPRWLWIRSRCIRQAAAVRQQMRKWAWPL